MESFEEGTSPLDISQKIDFTSKDIFSILIPCLNLDDILSKFLPINKHFKQLICPSKLKSKSNVLSEKIWKYMFK